MDGFHYCCIFLKSPWDECAELVLSQETSLKDSLWIPNEMIFNPISKIFNGNAQALPVGIFISNYGKEPK
ncbi:MAG: hypothetical protein C5B59_10755 [Bacteroidetes bacterium]|nr:MAG: hypothetical protein C5B59_10755 [Bacteroidota bacterium]